MTREEAIKEINRVFELAYANYIVVALTEGATVSDVEKLPYFNSQEPCDDAVSRQAVLNKAFEIKTGKNTSAMVIYAEDIRKELPVKPKLAFNERITTIPMPFE